MIIRTPSGAGMVRSLAAINPGQAADRIEVFYRTQKMADEGRAWFEALAGASRKADPAPALDPEAMASLMEQVVRSHYARWADEPIPALGDRTPRQAIATPAGLKGLLREYEAGEAAMARRTARGVVPVPVGGAGHRALSACRGSTAGAPPKPLHEE